VADLVIDPMGRGDMSQRVPRARTALEDARALWDGGAKAQEILDAADGLPNEKDVVLVHGDLNLRHALVSDTGRLAGVIDWGDMCRASRSVDLALYWSLFDADERAAFRAAYGPISDVAFATARVLALFLNAILAVYAREKNMIALEAEALRGLDQTLID
jgi:aminoglycoside phosphotransferase (APT) family kinase protein